MQHVVIEHDFDLPEQFIAIQPAFSDDAVDGHERCIGAFQERRGVGALLRRLLVSSVCLHPAAGRVTGGGE
jgi:hypothetical protein